MAAPKPPNQTSRFRERRKGRKKSATFSRQFRTVLMSAPSSATPSTTEVQPHGTAGTGARPLRSRTNLPIHVAYRAVPDLGHDQVGGLVKDTTAASTTAAATAAAATPAAAASPATTVVRGGGFGGGPVRYHCALGQGEKSNPPPTYLPPKKTVKRCTASPFAISHSGRHCLYCSSCSRSDCRCAETPSWSSSVSTGRGTLWLSHPVR